MIQNNIHHFRFFFSAGKTFASMAIISSSSAGATTLYNLILSPPNLACQTGLSFFSSAIPQHPRLRLEQIARRRESLGSISVYEVGGGFPVDEIGAAEASNGSRFKQEDKQWSQAEYEVLLKGGEQVASVLEEMAKLLDDVKMDDASEEVAVQLAAQGVIGKRVDEMETGFMMALDYMIQMAVKDEDYKRKSLLEVIKETVLSHLTKKCPPHVQVVGLLCQTSGKESRQELLRRVAAGGGVFKSDNGATKVHLPAANLSEIANQADDLLESMETRPDIPDRKLLARLVLVREEARSMMGGGILDERNGRGFSTLPESEVNFLTKVVALRPGKAVREMIKNVMQGNNEGADELPANRKNPTKSKMPSGIAGKGSVTGVKPLPVRPGMFLETVTKVLGGIYVGNVSGITAQQLEWIHQNTLEILQEIAF